MRRPFSEMWDILEARRREVEAGIAPPTDHTERVEWAKWHARGCPDEEALCGWVDGWLRRQHRRRWLQVWRHVQLQRCPACCQEIATLRALTRSSRRPQPCVRQRAAWRASTRLRRALTWLRPQASLAWASGALVVVLGLTLWSIDDHAASQRLRRGGNDTLFENTWAAPRPRIEMNTKGSAGHLLFWGD